MEVPDLLLQIVDDELLRVRRIFFTHGDNVERAAGPLELRFKKVGVLLFDVGPDGEMLMISDQPWQDPFESGPVSAENRAWIAEHGKWTSFDVSDEPAYSGFVGKALTSVKVLRTAGGNVCGVRLGFDSLALDFLGNADEALVFLTEQNDLRLAALKVFVGEEVAKSR